MNPQHAAGANTEHRTQNTEPLARECAAGTPAPWLAFYVRSRCEKVIVKWLEQEGIEAYVPIHTVVRQWSDRKKNVEEPLIRCYVFARPTPKQYFSVLNTDGVVRCIYFEGKPAPIPDSQIEMLRVLVSGQVEVEIAAQALAPGQKVKFVTGPMAGFGGELLEIAGKHKVVLRLDHVAHSFLITADPKLLQVVQN